MFSLKNFKTAPILAAMVVGSTIALPLAVTLPTPVAQAQINDPGLTPDPMPSLPAVTEAKLLKAVAKQLRVPVKQLKVERSQLATFSGCLGIYVPGQACTAIAISGWKAVLSRTRPGAVPTNLVYNLDQTASQIAFNATASGGTILPVFDQFGGPINPSFEPNLVFRSYDIGSNSGQMVYHTLTTDGKITRLVTGPTIRSRPVLVRQLTPTQLKQFQKSLETNRLPNLNGYSYLTSASFADAPTITFDVGSVVQYTQQDLNKAPLALRRIARDWNNLIK
ncbi:MAG: hypothetical protein HC860_03780 [Alkalinema sp. RU_4_3]|nr:hypothetical protein [Alkalinema sp. RU_4_3]